VTTCHDEAAKERYFKDRTREAKSQKEAAISKKNPRASADSAVR
jgi:hypothetical protein